MKNKILAAQQEDAARRLIQMVLTREGLSPVEDPQALEKNGERMVVVTYQVSITDSGSTAPVQTITMAARPEDLLAHTGGLQMDRLEFGRLAISYRGRSVTVEGRELPLTLKEFQLLAYLIYHKNLVLTRSQLLAGIWDVAEDFVNDNTLTVYIKRLREKLEDNPQAPFLIRTVRGLGYTIPADLFGEPEE